MHYFLIIILFSNNLFTDISMKAVKSIMQKKQRSGHRIYYGLPTSFISNMWVEHGWQNLSHTQRAQTKCFKSVARTQATSLGERCQDRDKKHLAEGCVPASHAAFQLKKDKIMPRYQQMQNATKLNDSSMTSLNVSIMPSAYFPIFFFLPFLTPAISTSLIVQSNDDQMVITPL